MPGDLGQQPWQGPLGGRPRLPAQVDLVEGEHVLVWCAVGFGEHGAQRLVPAHHVVDGRRQRLLVQTPGEPQRDGHVVGGRGALHLVEEPQALLREGQRNHIRTRLPHQGFPDRSTRQPGREASHRRGFEQGADTHLDTEDRANPARQPGRQQRVAPQGEEVVIDADRGRTEDVREQFAEHCLPRGARRAEPLRDERRSGQGTVVEFPARCERHGAEDNDGRGHQVGGQVTRSELPQGLGQSRHGPGRRRFVHGRPGVRFGPVRSGQRRPSQRRWQQHRVEEFR